MVHDRLETRTPPTHTLQSPVVYVSRFIIFRLQQLKLATELQLIWQGMAAQLTVLYVNSVHWSRWSRQSCASGWQRASILMSLSISTTQWQQKHNVAVRKYNQRSVSVSRASTLRGADVKDTRDGDIERRKENDIGGHLSATGSDYSDPRYRHLL